MLTAEEKKRLAESVRASNFIEPVFDSAYTAYQDQVCIEEAFVPTSQGPSHIYIHRAKSQRENCPILINIHGGGFVRPHMPCNRYFCAKMAARTAGIAVDIDYRLAPEFPYPAAFLEVYDVVRWVFAQADGWGADAGNITLCGHSAGGNLALVTAMKANLTKAFRVRRQILDFACVDSATDPASKPDAENSVMSMERMRAFNTLYTDDRPEIVYSPYVSPRFAPDEMFLGLPETVILTAGKDLLRFEMEEIAGRMAAQGVLVTVQRFLNSNHGFTVHCTGDWAQAQDLIEAKLKENDGPIG